MGTDASMVTSTDLDVLLIGHVTRDRITINSRTEFGIGGGVYYGSFPLRCIGLRTGVVTRLRPSDANMVDPMRDAGVQVFMNPAVETTQIENVYLTTDQEERISRMTGFAGAFQSNEVPAKSRRVTLVSPMVADEVDLALLKEVTGDSLLALDVQGFTRAREGENLVARDWREKAEGLALATFAKMDRAEAQVLTGLADPRQAIGEIAAWGPREIMISYNGGVLLYVDRRVYQASITPRVQTGRTGRGDTCFAAFVGCRLKADPEQALHFAAALTSLKLESPGPFHGTLGDVDARMSETLEE
jgi:sugar/nucleoside kinase (ribokinase family)